MMRLNQPWNEYQETDALNGSTLALLLPPGSPKYLKHVVDEGIGPQASTTRVGSGLHSIVEALPDVDLNTMWRVMPDYKLDPGNVTGTGKPSTSKTQWVRDQEYSFRTQAEADGIDVLHRSEYRRITRMLGAIANNPEAMDLIVSSEREVSVTGEIAGVKCKGRVDGVRKDGVQWNLKTCGAGITARKFSRTESDFHYLFKDSLHRMLLAQNGHKIHEFRYILVDDCKPWESPHEHAGKFARPADCIVVDVPIDVLSSLEDHVIEAVELYRRCDQSGEWPGQDAYTYVPYAPAEITLEP